ncbi:hypothetical protein G4B88_026317 [Cannabis sativa]|uniref:DUF4283 domain-containing protein n=1 Tax=Cannabis sativa TaxID=3483 RepID=A0A7J6FXD0_CANSA|nr:hypothetical protein G4B88_026317 [Cannabis sativa]
MDPTGISGIFEDTIQLTSEDITFSLNPGEVDEPQESNKVLLVKIISRYKLGKAPIQGSLKLSWNAIKGWKWKEIEGGIIQFTFAKREDAMNVLARRPWFVCGALLVLMPWPAWLTPAEIRFDKTPIWVHVESIPPFYWNLSNLKEIAAKSSPVYELPPGIDDAIGMSTLRFRATSFFLRRQKLKDLWLQYRYEKLPKLCFKCGILTHDQSTCFKPPTVVKDTMGNYYPLYGTWLKNDAQEKSTFSSPLPKWFQDWVLQKQLGKDPVLCNQFKIQKAIRNGESDEMRESRIQLPSKHRIVSDDDREDQDGGEPAQIITQLPLVYLPGIGEIAPYGNTKSYAGKETLRNTLQEDQPSSENESNSTPSGVKSQSSASQDKPQRDSTYFNPSYSVSPLGSQTQFISWPSNECWAQPKARELLMGSLTVDKFHREPTLFNPLLSIDDFRVEEHLKGPRKRKSSDGFLFSPPSKPINQTYRECAKEGATLIRTSCESLITEEQHTATEEQATQNHASFTTGHDIDTNMPKQRGRPRKNSTGNSSSGQSLKKRGRPPKNQQVLAANAKQFKWRNSSKAKNGYNSTIKHHWEGKTIDLKIDLDNHFVKKQLCEIRFRFPSYGGSCRVN